MTLNKEGRIATVTVTNQVYGNTDKATYKVASDVAIQGDVSRLVKPTAVELKGKDKVVETIIIK